MTKVSRAFKENMVYLALWLLLALTPVVSMVFKTLNHPGQSFDWAEVLHVWSVYVVFLIPFLLHNFLLAPLLIYRSRARAYLCGVAVLLALFFAYQYAARPVRSWTDRHRNEVRRERVERWRHEGRRPGGPCRDSVAARHPGGKPGGWQPRRLPAAPPDGGPHPPFFFEQMDLVNTIVLVLLLGMNLGIKLYFKQEGDRKQLLDLERRNLAQQLEYLKFQINPHFFMNTLNNIHALVDIDPAQAKKSIVVLSRMMSYLLYEGNNRFIPLEKELAFISRYIDLMRLRYTDRVRITLTVAQDGLADGQLPPLSLFTFVENAFKHGITYRRDCFISVAVAAEGDTLHLRCHNSKADKPDEGQGGVGIQNVRQRLDLIYGHAYTLDIADHGDTYEVNLRLPLRPDSQNNLLEKTL